MTTGSELDVGRGRDGVDPGVIHDIGYRHHEGPRLGRRYAQRSLFVDSLKGAYGLGRSARSKVMPALLVVAICLPAVVIAIVTAVIGEDGYPLTYTGYAFNLQAVVAIYLAAQAPVVVSRDLRFRVLSLYFSRPMERVDYVRAKYAAMTAATAILLALPLTILFLGALLSRLPVAEHLPDYVRGLATAGLHAVVLAGIALVVAALTPRRGLGVAAVVSVLLVASGVQAAVRAIALEAGAADAAAYSALLSPFALVDATADALLGEGGASGSTLDVPEGLLFLAVAVLLVVASYVALVARYRKVSVS